MSVKDVTFGAMWEAMTIGSPSYAAGSCVAQGNEAMQMYALAGGGRPFPKVKSRRRGDGGAGFTSSCGLLRYCREQAWPAFCASSQADKGAK
jgi:hypothetical protein